MRWRLIVLGCLAVAFAVGFVLCTVTSLDVSDRAQEVMGNLQTTAPTDEQQAESFHLYQQSFGLTLLMPPLFVGALICGMAVPAVLGRRWQLREAASRAQ
jgi:hypothetical protein